MRDAVQIAKEANRLTEESVRGRIAIVNYRIDKPLTVGNKIAVIVETENIGHASTFDRHIIDSQSWVALPDGDMPVKVPGRETNMPAQPGSKGTLIVYWRPALSADTIQNIGVAGKPQLYFFGRIVYETLGKEHYINFCAYIRRFDQRMFSVDSPGTKNFGIAAPYGLMRCPKWNDES